MSNVFCIGNGTSRKNFNLEKLRPHGKIYGCNAIYRTFTPDVLISVDHGIMHEIYHSGYCENNETWFRDWNKIPAHMYESIVYAGVKENDKEIISEYNLITSNKKINQNEFVMHGANLQGLVGIVHRDEKKKIKTIEKRDIRHSSLCISWTNENDKTHDLKEIMIDEKGNSKDHGWSAGPTSGYIAVKKHKPKRVYLIGHDLYSNDNKVNNMYAGSKHYVIPEHGPTSCVNWINQWKTLSTWEPNVELIKVNEFNDSRDKTNMPINEWQGTPNIRYINFQQLDKELGI
jgi:hypothetical protein